MINGLGKEGKVDEANGLLELMSQRGLQPNLVTFNTMISGLCKEGKIEEANGLMELMIQRGLQPNVVTFNSMIDGLCKEGKMEEANNLLELMSQKGCKFLVEIGMSGVEEAFEQGVLVDERAGLQPNVVTFNSMIDGLCKEGKMEEANGGLQPNVVMFTIMISGLCELGKMEEVNGLFELMNQRGCKIVVEICMSGVEEDRNMRPAMDSKVKALSE
ncbi:pentatricopeptide repeat-containing protein At1g63400-like [Pistacia vera]|uniref:pentatricopeptide repeat-containing protein At1g63400-like n=1 Tax=Pistacia vera TaxID=55513 RepID=UPI0012638168|nr:pentatricopeptide repeat-containing protein At1g63400-like [Pistacia vera]